MRSLRVFGLLLLLAGCQAPPERAPLSPLIENQQLTYRELYRRARRQAELVNDAFYDDKWMIMEEAAKGLQETSRYLAKATEIPDPLKNEVGKLRELDEVALKLTKAANSKDVKASTVAMTEMHNLIRRLRPPDEATPPPPPVRN